MGFTQVINTSVCNCDKLKLASQTFMLRVCPEILYFLITLLSHSEFVKMLQHIYIYIWELKALTSSLFSPRRISEDFRGFWICYSMKNLLSNDTKFSFLQIFSGSNPISTGLYKKIDIQSQSEITGLHCKI